MIMHPRNFVSSIVLVAFCLATAPSSYSQNTDGTTSEAVQSATTTKEQRKAARKEARAKKNAELKKLESAGYNPAKRDETEYPQDIQNAEKKAGVGAGASQ